MSYVLSLNDPYHNVSHNCNYHHKKKKNINSDQTTTSIFFSGNVRQEKNRTVTGAHLCLLNLRERR